MATASDPSSCTGFFEGELVVMFARPSSRWQLHWFEPSQQQLVRSRDVVFTAYPNHTGEPVGERRSEARSPENLRLSNRELVTLGCQFWADTADAARRNTSIFI